MPMFKTLIELRLRILIGLVIGSLIITTRPSKPDSAPVRGDGYKPRSLKFRSRANAETSYSVRTGPGGGCGR